LSRHLIRRLNRHLSRHTYSPFFHSFLAHYPPDHG
jgi:hypothetical protein